MLNLKRLIDSRKLKTGSVRATFATEPSSDAVSILSLSSMLNLDPSSLNSDPNGHFDNLDHDEAVPVNKEIGSRTLLNFSIVHDRRKLKFKQSND